MNNMKEYSILELLWLNKITGRLYCVVTNGIAVNIQTSENIPDSLFYNPDRPDGQYELGEMTCGSALPDGDGGSFEDTPENREKYQCRIGRNAPLCKMYSPVKCAIYTTTPISKYKVNISVDKLLDLRVDNENAHN